MNKSKPKAVGFNLTKSTRLMLYNIAVILRLKRSQAVIKLLEMLFSDLVNDENFKQFVAAFDRINRTFDEESSYTSFYIPKDYMEKFYEVMFDFKIIDRSPFLRLLIDYVYNYILKPVDENSIKRVIQDLKKINYKIKSIGPILDGDLYLFIENPYKNIPGKSKKTKR